MWYANPLGHYVPSCSKKGVVPPPPFQGAKMSKGCRGQGLHLGAPHGLPLLPPVLVGTLDELGRHWFGFQGFQGDGEIASKGLVPGKRFLD